MIKSFSFRYGDNTGRQEWFRIEDDDRAICVRIDKRDKEETTFFTEVRREALESLEETVKAAGLSKWNGFHDIDTCLCSGDSWVLHIFYNDGGQIHGMGHSAKPDGFREGKEAIESFFDKLAEKNK